MYINNLYVIVKSFPKKKNFTIFEFIDLININNEEIKKNDFSKFYEELLNDNRFIYIGNSQWTLREYLNKKEINEYIKKNYKIKISLIKNIYLQNNDKNDESEQNVNL